MPKIISQVKLTDKSAEYLAEITESLEGENITDQDGIVYALETLMVIEKMLEPVGITDPADFVTGLSNGSLLIVKK